MYYMKIDISSSPEQIQKSIKSCGRWFTFCIVCGIFCLGGNMPLAFILFALSFWLFRKKKSYKQLLIDQKTAAEAAEKAAEEEKSERIRKSIIEEEERRQVFLASHECFKEIHTKVVGVTFRNGDGSSRQEILSTYCFDGDQLELRPFTYKGAPAYAVFDGGEQIGNISAELAQTIHDQSPDAIRAEITEITGGDGLNYGCNILIQLYRNK